MFIVILFLSCISMHGQTRDAVRATFSADIAAIITSGNVSLEFEHSFSGHWSANAGASVQMPMPLPDTAEEEHDSLLSGGDGCRKQEKRSPELRAGFRFWPIGFMQGTYMGISCFHGINAGTDMSISLGYAVKVWKCIGISGGYELKMLDSISGDKLDGKGFRINITYLF